MVLSSPNHTLCPYTLPSSHHLCVVSLRKPPSPRHVTTDDLFALFPPPPPDRPSSLRRSRGDELLFHVAMGFAPCGDYRRNPRRISAPTPVQPPGGSPPSGGSQRSRRGLPTMGEIECPMEERGEVGGEEGVALMLRPTM
ncbi:hypothetical protein NL676_030338 [Syzygium grande]|nr:hypothetical protein NL676_030338 [Syzygium grande]